MKLLEIVREVRQHLEETGRVSFRLLRREYDLYDDALEEVIEELVEIQGVAVREADALAWNGDVQTPAGSSATPASAPRDPRDYTPKHLAEKILRSKSALEGERKQVTVLFADVKGSLELAEQVDPEEWHRIMDRFFQILAEGVHRYEGTINQYTGDGIMALFGAPIAHEDHARRACYAALRLSDELRRYADELRREKGLSFSVRMGLNSGEVVVGKIGDDLRMDYTAQGHTVGLAARVEEIAAPDRTYLTEPTATRVEGFFRLRDLGRFDLKGVSEPARVYELQDVGPLRTRLEVAARRGLTRFVGRREEMEQLRRAWAAAQQGHGQIVAVVGEAGVGKSRLFYEFKVPVQASARVLEAYSVSHGRASSYLPLIELLKAYFEIELEDDERRRREKMTGKVLTLDRQFEDTLPYLFTLLGVPDPAAALAQMDPQIRRRRTQEAVKRLLVRESLERPCVVIFEDLHWIDDETQAFLDQFAEAVATAPLLLLANYRPEYRHGWASKSCYTLMRLDPLGPEEAEELLTALLGTGSEAAEMAALRELILAKTEGNPFFLEEVVQTLSEEGILAGDRGAYRLERPLGELLIPETVQGVLAARIDRLPAEGKALLQTLAVIGKEFPFGLVRKVTEEEEEALHVQLAQLQMGEFVYEQPAFPEPEYTFKHALTQEVAYGSVLVERRKALHERTARAIEALHRDSLDGHYGELAHHYGRTDDVAKALEYLQLAGEQATERSTFGEAIGHLERGLELLERLPGRSERVEQELRIQLALGSAFFGAKGVTSPEAEAAFVRARALCDQIGETDHRESALGGLWVFRLGRGELEQTRELEEELFAIAQRRKDTALLAGTHARMGDTSFWRGRLSKSWEHLREAIRLWDPLKDREVSALRERGWAGISARNTASHALWYLGHVEQSLTRSQESLALVQEASPFSRAIALGWASVLHQHRGEAEVAREQAEALIALAHERGFPNSLAAGMLVRGWVLTREGKVEEGTGQMGLVLDGMRATGEKMYRPYALALLAEVYGETGRAQEALALIAEAKECTEQTGGRISESRLHRLEGEFVLADSQEAEANAEACFFRALEVARHQESKMYELQAAMSLARLRQRQDRRQEARELLAPIYGCFTEGLDTRDLKDAKTLLVELEQ